MWVSLRTATALLCASLAFSTSASALSTSSEDRAAALNSPGVFFSELKPCPAACPSRNPQDWTVYASFDRFALCHEPMLFDFAIHTPVNDASKTQKFRACTAGDSWKENSNARAMSDPIGLVYDSSQARESKVMMQTIQRGSSRKTARVSSGKVGQKARTALKHVQEYLKAGTDFTKNIMLAYSDGVIVGVYAGQAFGKSTAPSAIDELLPMIDEASSTTVIQLCGNPRDADHVLGIVVSPAADLATVQGELVSWSKGNCSSGTGRAGLVSTSVWEVPQRQGEVRAASSNTTGHVNLYERTSHARDLVARETKYCMKKTVVSGDTCPSLAKACGISLDKFYEYNSKSICNKLQISSRVCCTDGSLKPQPYDNGTCYTYTTQPDDTCDAIGLTWSITADDLASFNDGTTWGWSSCDNLSAGQNICLSKGNPPMPAVLPNALCGPQVPDTTFDGPIEDAQDLASLNPCPLHSCCNIWGQCGIDSTFCTKSKGPTGNPGTSEPGIFGCVSNCGTDIVNNDEGPEEYQRVGYYESYNWDRKCLHMRAEWSNTLDYTHMHWAFASVDENLSVYVNDTHNQWDKFMGLKDVKKIVSFGGWGFSTEQSTYNILRRAMDSENRDLFVKNLVAFAEETGVDGIDIDWEYPGAPDIPGIPPGLESDSPNYLATLKTLREKLPDKYSIAMAAPASYWYLKAFPIREMAEVVDYIVYMAYDLHGQWDYGNSFSQSGCPGGNCLRSHVNQTEVNLALSMITKAGVHSNKIMVGESSYGRSFKMAKAGCTGPDCFYVSTSDGASAAKPGRCTNTAGYLADAEIKEVISRGGDSVKTWYDNETASDHMVYNELEWTAYLGPNTKQARRDRWKELNFRGTIDWAVDLQEFNIADSVGETGEYNKTSCINVFDNMIWDWTNPVVEAPVGCTNLIQASPLATTVTRTAYTTLTLVSGTSLSTTVVSTVFPISEVNYQPFTIASTDTKTGTVLTYKPVPRVNPSPLGVTVPNGWTITSPGGKADGPTSTTSLIGALTTSTTSITTTTTTTDDDGGFLWFVTWNPTISYSLPSVVKPKIIAPVTIPNDDNTPTATPDPGVVDCIDSSCKTGPDCTDDDCTRGGDCTGPGCTRGGDCTGPRCIRGGVCIGENCEGGGDCEGDDCVSGGSCSGPKCHQGGRCKGDKCNSGGGCVTTLLKKCSPGPCSGPGCSIDTNCPGCDNQIVITVQPMSDKGPKPTPKPTCLTNCPTFSPCAGGGSSCNEPCNLDRCPPNSMPTDKACTSFTTASDCTEFVSSSRVKKSPVSYSTTTRTRCNSIIDCDVQDMTATTTITTSGTPAPEATVYGIYDFVADNVGDQDVLKSIASEYEEWERTADTAYPTTSTTTTIITTTIPKTDPSPTPYADCASWDQGWGWRFEIYNIQGWAKDGGKKLHKEEKGCATLTGWDWNDATKDKRAKVWFNTDFFMKAGCVERAIVSAGGPKISCKAQPLDWFGKRQLEARRRLEARAQSFEAADFKPLSPEQEQEAVDAYGADGHVAKGAPHPTYIPMDWVAWEASHNVSSSAVHRTRAP